MLQSRITVTVDTFNTSAVSFIDLMSVGPQQFQRFVRVATLWKMFASSGFCEPVGAHAGSTVKRLVMSIQTCPTTMVEAPADRVWHLLTTPSELQRWSGLKIVKGPDRPLATGDQIVFRAGLIRFQVMKLAS